MTYVSVLVVLTLALPWAGQAITGRLVDRLPPRWASWTLVGAAVLLAGGTISALVGLAHVPFLASLEQLPLTRVLEVWPAAVPLACAAGALMLVQLMLVVRRWIQHRSLLRKAWLLADEGTGEADVLVVPGADVDAFALPGYRGREGRVVVTSGMVRSLKPQSAKSCWPMSVRTSPGVIICCPRWSILPQSSIRRYGACGRRWSSTWSGGRTRRPPRSSGTGAWPPRRLPVRLWPVPPAVVGLDTRCSRRRAGRCRNAFGRCCCPSPQRRAVVSGAPAVGALAGAVALSAVAALALAYGLHEYVEYAARRMIGASSG